MMLLVAVLLALVSLSHSKPEEEYLQKECLMANSYAPKPNGPLKNRIQLSRNKETKGNILVSWQALEGADEYQVYYLPKGLMDYPATAGPVVKNSCGGNELLAVITDADPNVPYTVYIRATRNKEYFAFFSSVDVEATEERG